VALLLGLVGQDWCLTCRRTSPVPIVLGPVVGLGWFCCWPHCCTPDFGLARRKQIGRLILSALTLDAGSLIELPMMKLGLVARRSDLEIAGCN